MVKKEKYTDTESFIQHLHERRCKDVERERLYLRSLLTSGLPSALF
jgi:hypothetical protein